MRPGPAIIALLSATLASGSCLLASPHDRCHQRALEQLGCCPFHGEDCGSGGGSMDGIREACADEFAGWDDDEDEPSSTPADLPEPEPELEPAG